MIAIFAVMGFFSFRYKGCFAWSTLGIQNKLPQKDQIARQLGVHLDDSLDMTNFAKMITSLLIFVGMLGTGCGHLPFEPNLERRVFAAPVALQPEFGSWGFRSELLAERSDDTVRVERFSFQSYCGVFGRVITIEGEIFTPAGSGPFPLIAVSPILGGASGNYVECTIFGNFVGKAGLASFYLYQEKTLLGPWQNSVALEQKMRSWTRSMIKTLDLVSARPEINSEQIGSFGISLGGIRNTLLTAAEPRVRASVICLAGGPLSEVFQKSHERLVLKYLWRRKEILGCTTERIVRDIARHFVSDPFHVAQAVDPSRLLLFLAKLDNKVPIKTGRKLRQALGNPECRLSPLGHYTSIVVLPWVSRHSLEFFKNRFEAMGSATELSHKIR